MSGRVGGNIIVYATPSQYQTSLLKNIPKNNTPLSLKQVSTIPTLDIYQKHFSLTITRDIMTAYNVTKLWKFL
jgi:hypothetical protein